MRKSIRLRLVMWCAAVLTLVVVGYAVFLYSVVRSARLAELDSQLETTAARLDSAMRLFPPHELTGESAPPPPPNRPDGEPAIKGPRGAPGNGAPASGGPGRGRLLTSLNPMDGPLARRDQFDLYYGVWRSNGTEIRLVGLPEKSVAPGGVTAKPKFYTEGANRELVLFGPHRTVILVGRPSARIHAELAEFAWLVVGTGLAVLGVGLAGVWVISHRIFRPVARIADTASRISESNLTERIDPATVELELSGLAGVLNEAFERLQTAFDRQVRFTADASHELRTPLAIIRTQSELTLSRTRTADEYRKTVEVTLRAVVRMSELVERLLLLARADAGPAALRREPVELDRLVSDITAQLKPLAEEHQVTLRLSTEPATMMGDATALHQVVGNLISNAIRYNRPGGRVRIAVSGDHRGLVLTVEDTGAGIAEEHQQHLFDRYYRADLARTRTTGGSGLGLAICKAIVLAHKGEINFESVSGVGSTFRVTLPQQHDEAGQAATTPLDPA